MESNKLPWGITRLENMIGDKNTRTLVNGSWPISVPLPYPPTLTERIRAAWWVLTNRAHAVVWPKVGDLERHLGQDI